LWFFEKCPDCDIALAHHSLGGWKLICHQCGFKNPVPLTCSYCQGSTFHLVGVGIQRIEQEIKKLLPDYHVLRIDSDNPEKNKALYEQAKETDIIIATNRAFFLTVEDIGAIVFLLFEINFSIPDYTVEESTAYEIAYFKKKNLPIYIQTYMPEHPLLSEIVSWNTRSTMQYLAKERKDFSYPPFSVLIWLTVHHEKKEKVSQYAATLLEKIARKGEGNIAISYDSDTWSKNRAEWVQKITLRWSGIEEILQEIERDIVLNYSITVERA
jgi:primosomal protein N' (replication factor Y)